MSSNKGKKAINTDSIIQYVGLKDLTPDEQLIVQQISTDHSGKIIRDLPALKDLVVHIKVSGDVKDSAKRRKYSLHVRSVDPRNTFESTSDDWDLPTALHKSFEEVKKQIEHTLHTDVSHHKTYC